LVSSRRGKGRLNKRLRARRENNKRGPSLRKLSAKHQKVALAPKQLQHNLTGGSRGIKRGLNKRTSSGGFGAREGGVRIAISKKKKIYFMKRGTPAR